MGNEVNPDFGDIPQKNRPPKPVDPRGRMGVYQTLEDVPNLYRLSKHEAEYDGVDVWGDWQALRLERNTSDRFRQNITRTGRKWKGHMDERGRHHALATPADVEAFFEWIIDDKGWKVSTAYQPYFNQLSTFYDWLLWNVNYPHRYDPVLMAAAAGEFTGKVWQAQIEQNDKR